MEDARAVRTGTNHASSNPTSSRLTM